MALKKLYIDGVVGLTYVENPLLTESVEIILVMREGKAMVETTGIPTGKEFKHVGSETRIYVAEDQPISLAVSEDPSGTSDLPRPEVFYVEYKS